MVVELTFAIHMNTFVVVRWVIHLNYSHHYATGEKGGTKREKREKKNFVSRPASAAAARQEVVLRVDPVESMSHGYESLFLSKITPRWFQL